MSATSGTDTALLEKAARAVATLIIVAGLFDPSCTVSRVVPPIVALVSADTARYAPTLHTVRERLAGSATVVAGPAPGAAVQIVVGSELPPTQVTDAQASFVVTAPIDGVHLTGWEAPPVAPLDAKVLLRVSVERDGKGNGQSTTNDAASRATRAGDDIPVTVEVREDGALVGASTVAVAAGARQTIAVPYVPVREGTHRLDVSLVIGADTVRWRDALYARNSAWRVLVYDPRPSWLSTFVRRSLERDERFRVSSRVVTSKQVSRATTEAASSLSALAEQSSLPDVVVVGAPDALSRDDVAALDRLARVRGLSVVLLPDHLPASGTLAPAASGLDALTGTSGWRQLPAQPANAPRVVSDAFDGRSGSTMSTDSMHLLATVVAAPERLSPDVEVLAKMESPGAEGATPVIWLVPRGAGAVLVSGAFDAWRFRDPAQSTFDETWRALMADAAARRAPSIELVASPSDDAWPRSVLLRTRSIDVATVASPAPPALVEMVDGRSLTAVASPPAIRLLATPVPHTWRVVWDAPPNADSTAPSWPLLLRAVMGQDTAFLPMPTHARGGGTMEMRPTNARTTEQLADWAQARNGRLLRVDVLDSLPALVQAAAGVQRRPSAWHPMRSGWWIVPLTLAFGTEWWLRRRRGSS